MGYPIGTVIHGHANLWYLSTIDKIVRTGDKVITRGRTTWEVLHATTRLPDPRKRVLTIPYRRANPFFQAMETVWILAGRADAAWITYYNSRLAQFLDSYETGPGWVAGDIKKRDHFHGAYGERLVKWGRHLKSKVAAPAVDRNQIKDVILQLLAEASSRRAVMAIHNPDLDNPSIPTLDKPCNLAMSYQLRQGRLFAVTFNRSNDLNLGLAFTNIVQFTTIQEFIAAALSVEVGHYTHFSSSLHVYHDDPVVQRLMRPLMVVKPIAGLTEVALTPGQVVSPPDTEVEAALPTHSDVYQWCASTPMKKWSTSEEGWDAIRILEIVGDPETHQDMTAAVSMVEALSCPYWRSIGWMALSWHALKTESLLGTPPSMAMLLALDYLSRVDAHDWLIACLEFVHRWSARRGIEAEFRKTVSKLFGTFERPEENFILHDGVASE